MAGLSDIMKNKITQVLAATYFTEHGFTVKYDDKKPMADITLSSRPEYRFVINSSPGVNAFTTSESPGVHSDAAETFHRGNFDLCLGALKEWTDRIIDREKDWMMDEFGGVADRSPSY